MPAEERRAATVEAMVELAAEQNPSEITTAAIAEQMGLSHGALFRHFRSKEAILEAVMTWVSERLLARVDRAAAGAPSPLAALEAVFMTHIDFVARHPGVPRMLFGELQRPDERLPRRMAKTLLQHYGQRIEVLLVDGKAAGELDPGLDVEAAVLGFTGSVQGLVMQSLLSGDAGQMREQARRVFAIYRRGIGAAS